MNWKLKVVTLSSQICRFKLSLVLCSCILWLTKSCSSHSICPRTSSRCSFSDITITSCAFISATWTESNGIFFPGASLRTDFKLLSIENLNTASIIYRTHPVNICAIRKLWQIKIPPFRELGIRIAILDHFMENKLVDSSIKHNFECNWKYFICLHV